MTLLVVDGVGWCCADGGVFVRVLDGVSFELGVGEVVGLHGARRSGKSPLLRIVAGLEVSDRGVVCWDGRDLGGLSGDERAEVRRLDGIALMRGSWVSLESESVVDYVAMSIYGSGFRMGEARGLARSALAEAKVSHVGHKAVSELDVWERLHVGFAHALAHRPRLLLVDEPAVLRDMEEAERFYRLLRTVQKRRGFALLVASEDLAPLAGVDRFLHLANGQIIDPDMGDSDEISDNVVVHIDRREASAP